MGAVRVDLAHADPQDVATRVQWAGLSYGVTKNLFATAWFERDLGDFITLRLAGTFGFTDHDHGRELAFGGEASVWFHVRRFEATSELLVLSASFDSSTAYGEDSDGYRTRTSQYATRERSVTVPGYRSRMIGGELGVGTWSGYNRTRESSGSRDARAYTGYVFGGFSSGWVKSSMYRVSGYGTIGRSRYHRVFAHLMYAPLVTWADLDVARDEQPSQFPVGVRAGVENMFGRGTSLTFRAELVAFPAGGAGMVVLTLGFGSMFTNG